MRRLVIAGADLHYRIDGAGPPVLFLHGAGGHSLSWFQQIPIFSKAFTCVALDHPGFGLSEWIGPRMEMAEVLEGVAEHFGWQQVAVVAHSMGGWSALRFALRAPRRVSALVLSSTWAGLRLPGVLRVLDEREQTLHQQQKEWRERAPGAYLPGAGKRMLLEQPELHWLIAGIAATNRGSARSVWARDPHGAFDKLLMPETDVSEVQHWFTPTLCLTGDEDVVVPSEAVKLVAAQLRNGRLSIFEKTGHSIFLQRPSAFNEIVFAFLQQHCQAT